MNVWVLDNRSEGPRSASMGSPHTLRHSLHSWYLCSIFSLSSCLASSPHEALRVWTSDHPYFLPPPSVHGSWPAGLRLLIPSLPLSLSLCLSVSIGSFTGASLGSALGRLVALLVITRLFKRRPDKTSHHLPCELLVLRMEPLVLENP